MLTHISDAVIRVAGIWFLIGYVIGAGTLALIFWRQIRRPADPTLRLLRWQVDDGAVHIRHLIDQNNALAVKVSEKQRTIDELSNQVVQLYKDQDRLARAYVERANISQPAKPATDARRTA